MNKTEKQRGPVRQGQVMVAAWGYDTAIRLTKDAIMRSATGAARYFWETVRRQIEFERPKSVAELQFEKLAKYAMQLNDVNIQTDPNSLTVTILR